MSEKTKPGVKLVQVSLSDTATFQATRGFILQNSAAFAVRDAEGNVVTLPPLQAGITHAISITQARATNSGAVGTVTLVY